MLIGQSTVANQLFIQKMKPIFDPIVQEKADEVQYSPTSRFPKSYTYGLLTVMYFSRWLNRALTCKHKPTYANQK